MLDIPSSNMAPWYIEYFKMKKFEKMVDAGRYL